jgi:serine/threonine protein kinase
MSDATRIEVRGPPDQSWPGFALPRGTAINGYRIERILGSGGFGITYLAVDLLQQRFAIKEYYPRQFATREHMTVRPNTEADTAMFEDCRERFEREAKALVLLGKVTGADGGIVHVQTYFEAFGTCFLVMDYVEGTSLANVVRQEPVGLAPDRVRSLLTQLLSAVRIVHQAGLVHRDIKPANIILRENDRLVLIDFGATRQAAPTETSGYTQIYSGGYGPPEQMLGQRQGEFSDIYAIGAVCYRAIGGHPANALARQNSVAAGLADPQPKAASIGANRYPSDLLAAIDAALALDPAARPQNADAMLAMLGPAKQPTPPQRPVATADPSVGSPVPRIAAHGRWIAAAGVGVVALAALSWLVFHSPAPQPAPVTIPPQTATATPTPPVTPPVKPPSVEAIASSPPVSSPPLAPVAIPPPAQPPSSEAMLVPPPAVPSKPPPSSVPSAASIRFQRAREAAGALPCTALRVAAESDGVRVSGFAPAGHDLDWFLAGLRDVGQVTDDVTRVDRAACPILATLAPLVRATWGTEPPMLTMRVDPSSPASGTPVGVTLSSALPALYVDLFQPDGTVRHLLRPGQAERRSVAWTAVPPPGERLLATFGAAAPLDLGTRPETERITDYLDALRPRIGDGGTRIAADLALVTVRAAEPVAAKPPPLRPPPPAHTERCANILNRAQLGETLSDAELAALRTECRS